MRILCYGDSLTAGLLSNWTTEFEPYSQTLERLIPNSEIDHIGLSGWDTFQMISALDANVAVDVKDVEWKPAGLRAALRSTQTQT
mmetsp:Transcript_33025/g.51483  ORF Transcript_33025/g.51483 Transcript_33025/m.51483 type:complete len:85 (+) Transcript_33025:207-461(+)